MSPFYFPSHLQEPPAEYSAPGLPGPIYEISLATFSSSDWLKEPQNAHRLVQTLLRGHLTGEYALLDFMIWPEGFFARISLAGSASLSQTLKFFREKSTPSGKSPALFWDEELRWIRLVPRERLSESTRLFLEKADQIRREVSRSHGFSPNLFFFYRNSNLPR